MILLVHVESFRCLHNLPNSDMDYRIFNVDVVFLRVDTHGALQFIVSSKGRL